MDFTAYALDMVRMIETSVLNDIKRRLLLSEQISMIEQKQTPFFNFS